MVVMYSIMPETKLRRYLALLTLITASSQLPATPQHAIACMPRERAALLDFKRGVARDTANVLASWQDERRQEQQTADCCRWRGVRCSNRTGHVVELNLRNVAGSLHTFPVVQGLVGQISPSLLSLPRLRHLDLSWNALEGHWPRIPEFLGSLKNLRYLDLSGMSFSGSLPSQLGNLSKLEYLDLSYSYHSIFGRLGKTDSSDVSWLTHLLMLRYLNLGGVNLSATANWHQVMNLVPSLRFLSLSECSLSSANKSLSHHNLTKLETLDLSYNSFDHSVASCWFWNLTGLRRLNLAGTHLHGQFQGKLGRMTSLETLDLSDNSKLDVMAANVENLCNLEILHLAECVSYVNIVELFKWLPQCSSGRLKELHLQSNNLTGSLPPSVEKFTCLNTLELYGNQLTGTVPSEIGVLSNLVRLDLSYNKLQGVITEEHFANLSSLAYIDLSHNSVNIDIDPIWITPFSLKRAYFGSCIMGPRFPMWLERQYHVRVVDISSAGINDKLPDWFCTTFAKVVYLDISENRIIGRLLKCIEVMSVEELNLNSNELSGQIPRLPRNLTSLYIYNNSLSGPLPSNFGTPNIEILVLFSNYITGQLPRSICDSQSLTILDLENNLLSGELPRCNGMRRITFLQLQNNSFSGQFPSFLQRCTDLVLLDLSRNKFSGRLPMWLGELVELQFLQLSHNMFSGNIPTNISSLKYLQYLNLANNSMSGSIPSHLSNLTAMKRTNPFSFIDLVIIGDFLVNTKGQALEYHSLMVLEVVTLDLSFNGLSGDIPPEIASLDAVRNLNLSWNHLNGEIPKMIGAMQSLESLDLSKNMLSGEIPSSLSNLTALSYLDLSYNNLAGAIPQGSQLDTLYSENPSMYDGNIGLCGPPLLKNCSRNNTPSRSHDQGSEEPGFKPVSFCFGLGIGFLLGHWVVFCVLLFKRSWRFIYFSLFDKLYDQVYVFLVVTWRGIQTRFCTGTNV